MVNYMKQLKYIILYVGLLAISACTAEKVAPTAETVQNTEVRLVADISESGNASRADAHYIKKTFTDGDKIRLVNTVFYNTPNFDDEKTIFTFSNEYNAEKGYKFTQSSQTGQGNSDSETENTEDGVEQTQSVLTWNDFSPTSFVYIFEAVYYPGNTLFNSVHIDQNANDGIGFKNSDLLLAHHRMLLEDKYKDIELSFHHALAMVRVNVSVPIGVGGLQRDAFTEAYVHDVQPGFTVNYSSTISNDGLRTVYGTGEKKDITMWRQSSKVSSDNKTQTYTFLAIIPVPNVDDGEKIDQEDFVRFKVKVDNNTEKTYRFVRNEGAGAISLSQSHITVLNLKWDVNEGLPLLLSASIEPWKEAYADMILDGEDSNSNENNQEGGSNP